MRKLLLLFISVGMTESLHSLSPTDSFSTFTVNNSSDYSIHIFLSAEDTESSDDKEIIKPTQIRKKQSLTITVTNPFIVSFYVVMHIKTENEHLRIGEKKGNFPLENVTIGNPKGNFFWEQDYPVYRWGDKIPEELDYESSDEE
jgi:hypothetical protein